MSGDSPFTWKPTDVIEVTNASAENIYCSVSTAAACGSTSAGPFGWRRAHWRCPN